MKNEWIKIKGAFEDSAGGSALVDLGTASKAIMISIALSVVYCLVFIYLMSAYAEPLSWFCIIVFQIGLFAGSGGLFVYRMTVVKDQEDMNAKYANTNTASEKQLETMNKDFDNKKMLLLVVAVVLGVIGGCFLCCVMCYRQSLGLAIDVIDASADFLKKTKRIIGVSAIFFVLAILNFAVWCAGFAYVLSLNDINSSAVPQRKDIDWKAPYQYMALYMVFGLLWMQAFIDYCCKFVVLVSAATYYFNSTIEDGEDGGEADVSTGIKYMFVHSGSIALGSFIIAVVQMIRLIFHYLAEKAKESSGDN